MSPDDLEQLQETIDVLSDPQVLADVREAGAAYAREGCRSGDRRCPTSTLVIVLAFEIVLTPRVRRAPATEPASVRQAPPQ